jgi:hypothetical protein
VTDYRHIIYVTSAKLTYLDIQRWRWVTPKCFVCWHGHHIKTRVKARCNGDSLRAAKSRWQVDYRVSDL